MNLEDVIEPDYELQQDEWSLQQPTFGKNSQIKVVGWCGRSRTQKWYILVCSVCAGDQDLHGTGHFRATKSDLHKGSLPCGCSRQCRWTQQQWDLLCKRSADGQEYKYLGLAENFRRSATRVRLECAVHGVWETATISRVVHNATGCPKCGLESIATKQLKDDEEMIAGFMAVGTYHQDTIFHRISRQDISGKRPYWMMYCPDCNSSGEATAGALRNGSRPCECSPQRQRQAYINLIYDGDSVTALKFGVANNFQKRLKEQQVYTNFKLENFGVWKFKSKLACLTAERECKESLVCPVLNKQEMPDGWSETTFPSNIEKIAEIYERHGGVRIK